MTRMTSSVSPSEMTKDPMFVFNPDMSDKDMLRQATETWECLEDESAFDAPRRLELTDGREVWIPSRNRLLELGQTEIEWLGELTRPAAAVISETSASGEPVVLVDNTADLWAALEDFDDGFGSKGCGCNSGGSAPTWALLLLGLVGLRRRATRTR